MRGGFRHVGEGGEGVGAGFSFADAGVAVPPVPSVAGVTSPVEVVARKG